MATRRFDLVIEGIPAVYWIHATTDDDAERQARKIVAQVKPGAPYTLNEVKP